MELAILETGTLKQIQEAFNQAYPFLWLEFFHLQKSDGSPVRPLKIVPETTVCKLHPFNGIETIGIDGNKSVAQLEADFLEKLHIRAKVLRKSGNVWVPISYTSNWTLENQNHAGEQIVMD